MSTMHKPDAVPPSVRQIMDAIAGCEASGDELREMIAAALVNARREGAEAMRESAAVAAWSSGMDKHNERLGIPHDAREVGSSCAQAIRALPLPGKRKAVLLTDEQMRHVAQTVTNRFLGGGGLAGDRDYDWDSELSRAIEAAVLAANNLEVRHG